MRMKKEVKIGEKRIEVFELTVKQIKAAWKDLTETPPVENEDPGIFLNDTFLKKHWGMCIAGITLEESDDLTPSELKVIYDAFEEVNKIFFDLALKVEGENPMLIALRKAVIQDLFHRYAALSSADTSAPGTTDTVSS